MRIDFIRILFCIFATFIENYIIKHKEQKLAALDKFFKDNDFTDEIEDAADSIKLFIFSYADRELSLIHI